MEDSTWKQMERNISKEGFREGVADGRNASFQKGFDDGYAEGHRIGRILGEKLGKLKYLEVTGNSEVSAVETPALENPKLGACLICPKPHKGSTKTGLSDQVYETPYEVIVSAQKAHNDLLATKLKS